MNIDISVYNALGSPNIRAAIETMSKFIAKPTEPILKFEYFCLIIMFIMSAPPVEPFLKKTSPYPKPQSIPP